MIAILIFLVILGFPVFAGSVYVLQRVVANARVPESMRCLYRRSHDRKENRMKRLIIICALLPIGWVAGHAAAWGDGTICWKGETKTFPNEQSYYNFLYNHEGATEGSCVTSSTSTTKPAPSTSTASTTTTTPVTTSSPASTSSVSVTTSSSVSSPPTTSTITSETSSPGTSETSSPTSSPAFVPPETGSQPPSPHTGRTSLPATGAADVVIWCLIIGAILVCVGYALHAWFGSIDEDEEDTSWW